MSPQRIGGGCFCGAVRYSIALPPRWVAHCHCTMCRRAHGAAFVTWVGNLRGNFTLERGADVLTAFKSSGAATRHFCSRCGSMLFFESRNWADEFHVTLASLDDAAGLEPGANVYWSHRVAWGDASRPDLRSIDLPDHSGDP
jgi:hypothetical protein